MKGMPKMQFRCPKDVLRVKQRVYQNSKVRYGICRKSSLETIVLCFVSQGLNVVIFDFSKDIFRLKKYLYRNFMVRFGLETTVFYSHVKCVKLGFSQCKNVIST